MVYRRVRGLNWGGEPPRVKLCRVPSPPEFKDKKITLKLFGITLDMHQISAIIDC